MAQQHSNINTAAPQITTASHLVTRALSETDFRGDLVGVQTGPEMAHACIEAIEMVTDGLGVPDCVKVVAVAELAERGWAILGEARREGEVVLLDAVEAGDLRWDGSWIEYDLYRSV